MTTPPPTVTDLKVFVPARDFPTSRAFYLALGFRENWEHEGGMAELELGGVRILLQNFYVEDWAENFVMHLVVEDAQAWYERMQALVESGRFEGIRARPPVNEPWGSIVAYGWDPSGVLIHFAQPVPASPTSG